MTRHLAVLAVVLAWQGPVHAQTVSSSTPDCAPGARPVVSAGLPRLACASSSNVVINRGPEITPEPSEVRIEPRVEVQATPPVVTRPVTVLRPAAVYPSYPYPEPRRRASGLTLVYEDDNVSLRIGQGYPRRTDAHRPRFPHGHHGRGDTSRRAWPEARQPLGFTWPGGAARAQDLR